MAPLPKPPGQRRRRNKPPSAVKLGKAAAKSKIPSLTGEKSLLPSTRAWWRTVWTSPMSGVYLDADVGALRRLAGLIDLVARGDQRVTLLQEIRALEDRFGLSPVSRRRLQWEVDHGAPAEPGPKPDQEARWLRVVKSD